MALTRCPKRLNGSQCLRLAGHAGDCRTTPLRDGADLPVPTVPATAPTDTGPSESAENGGLAPLDTVTAADLARVAEIQASGPWPEGPPDAPRAPRTHAPKPSAYYRLIGPAPVCGPGDVRKAHEFLGRILRALDSHEWTRDERTRLRLLRDKWQTRARGKDPRFQAVGTKAGRAAWDVEVAARKARKGGTR